MQQRHRLCGCLLALSLTAMAQAPVWSHAGPAGIVGGPVEVLAAANTGTGVLLAGGAGGVWQIAGSGGSVLSAGAPVSALAVSGDGAIYAGTGDLHGARLWGGSGVELSQDGGASWTVLGGKELAGLAISQVLVSPGNPQQLWVATVAADDSPPGTQPGVYESLDGGGSWRQVLTGSVWDMAQSGSRWLAVSNATLSVSSDGTAFAPLALPSQPASWVRARAIAQAEGGFLVALALPSGAVSLWQIDAEGQVRTLPSPPVTANRRALALAEAPGGGFWVGGQGVAMSPDGGQSWQAATAPDGAVHVLAPTAGGGAWVGCDHGV
ncbi:MAG TPA: hypothetical protein VFP94_09715, partial [Terriglobales bacterium]|nr:hypothetical protein [Terriglobales bacterium]